MKTNRIIQGDALDELQRLEDQSINMCMTSPPYWALRDYGTASWEGGDENCNHEEAKEKSRFDYEFKETEATKGRKLYKKGTGGDAPHWKDKCPSCGAIKIDKQLGLEPTFDEYINKLCDIFDEVKRVLRDDGTCWVNIGDIYYGSSSYSNEGRAGFNPKDGNTSEWKRQFGNGKCLTCGKSCETQFCDRDCLNKQGNDFRSKNRQIPDKCLIMIPMRFAIEVVNRGWILRNTIIWHKRNCMPSSAKDRFTVDFEYIFFFSKKKKYYFEQQLEPTITKDNNVRDRDSTRLNNTPGRTRMGGLTKNDYDLKNKRTVWTINPKPFKEAHFAVYPEELCETPIKAGCPVGGIVLDPFFGAGTTGLVALKQNKKFIGIELNKEYIEIAKKRLKPHLEQRKLSH